VSVFVLQEREQQRLDKIHALQKTDIGSALAEQTQTQRDLEASAKTKDELAAENRERRLRERLERLEAKQQHAEAVRERRRQAAAAAAGEQRAPADDNQSQNT